MFVLGTGPLPACPANLGILQKARQRINAHLLSYCRQHQIDFTRSRAYRKNDNNFTEQKNFDVVRKHVGYARYDTPEAVELLNELYDRLRLMVNFVRPCAKLIEKTRGTGQAPL